MSELIEKASWEMTELEKLEWDILILDVKKYALLIQDAVNTFLEQFDICVENRSGDLGELESFRDSLSRPLKSWCCLILSFFWRIRTLTRNYMYIRRRR